MVATKSAELKNAVALVFSVHGWGNRKSVDKDKIKTDKTDKKLLNLSKRLIDPKGEIKEIEWFMNSTVKAWIVKNSVPSFFQEGVYLFNIDQVEEVEKMLQEQSKELKVLVEKFIAVYPSKIKEVEERLAENFNKKDYPPVNLLRKRFRFTWQWVEFNIPKVLPEDVFKSEKKKVEAMWASAGEQITALLRESFKKLIDHAVKALEVGTDGKTKAFRNSSFENIVEFIDTFKNRNLTNDMELEALVTKAQKILTGVENPQELKKDVDMRKVVEKGFSDITKKLDKMIEVKPSRKFSFDD
jgi:hypothetical protein